MKRYAFESHLIATELTKWIYGLYMTVKWPFMPFYVKYVHFMNSISCLIGQRCHSMKRYAFEGNFMATELTMLVLWPI